MSRHELLEKEIRQFLNFTAISTPRALRPHKGKRKPPKKRVRMFCGHASTHKKMRRGNK